MLRAAFCTLILLGIVVLPVDAQSQQCELPVETWQSATPDTVGLDAEILAAGEARITEDLPFLRSIVVVRHGCIAYERYFDDAAVDVRANGFSVTKSVTATLIGMAIEEGQIASVNSSIADYLTLPSPDPRERITIGHLLHMLSGLGWEEDRGSHIGGMLGLERDEVAFILSLPLSRSPGTFWNYSTADSHLLSAVLTGATGESAADYAQAQLFAPLGITDFEWTADANGINLGGTQLFWTPRDMAKFGLLYLHGGEWAGEQIVPSAWIDYLTEPQLADPSVYELSYAAHWWHVLLGDYPPMFDALGYGGQNILVAPELDMIVITTSDSYVSEDVYISGAQAQRQQDAIMDYIEAYILESVE